MEEKEGFEEYFGEKIKIKVDLILTYSREIQRIIGVDLQQLLVAIYFQGDDFAKKKIQGYCYTLLKNKNQLWDGHLVYYRDLYPFEN